jgi:Cystathionine beta-lyases/cystathionine gamma-synthases
MHSDERGDYGAILHHLGEDELPLNAVSPPIFQTSNFCFPSFAALREAVSDELGHCLYSRGNNPTVNLVEAKLAALERGEKAKLLGSGAAAISNAVMAFVSSGDHIVCVRDAYGWMLKLASSYLPRFGVEYSLVEGTDIAEIEAAIRPNTKLIYLESPTSMTFKLQDLAAVAALARSRGIKTIADNTWATPFFCNPIELGIDIVVHSGSKYFGGCSDIIAGIIIGTKSDIDRITLQESLQQGSVADPLMAWLLMRGLRTFHIRMPAHYGSAMAVGRFLESSPKVSEVVYPCLDSHPQAELARRQFRGGSGLLSFRIDTRRVEDIERFVDGLRLFKRAVSWGGYESLVFPGAAAYPSGSDIPPERVGLVRIHVGLEESASLIEDLSQALSTL